VPQATGVALSWKLRKKGWWGVVGWLFRSVAQLLCWEKKKGKK
jgi:hypothetical protein